MPDALGFSLLTFLAEEGIFEVVLRRYKVSIFLNSEKQKLNPALPLYLV